MPDHPAHNPIAILAKICELQDRRDVLNKQLAEAELAARDWLSHSDGMKAQSEAIRLDQELAALQFQLDYWWQQLRSHEVIIPDDVDLDFEGNIPALSDGG